MNEEDGEKREEKMEFQGEIGKNREEKKYI